MAFLVREATSTRVDVDSDFVVGRAGDCALQLLTRYVSTRHAQIRWRGSRWEIKDLRSTNGTYLNGNRLGESDWFALGRGDLLCFGDREQECWRLADAEPPRPMLMPAGGGEAVQFENGAAALPPGEPEMFFYLCEDGSAQVERPDDSVGYLAHQSSFEFHGVSWRYSSGTSSATTEAVQGVLRVEQASVHIRHSKDREHIEATVTSDGRDVLLENRSHLEFFLVLAEQRLADAEAGLSEGECGWIYKEELLRRLGKDRIAANQDAHRLRQQLRSCGFVDARKVIELRTGTNQLRLSLSEIAISVIGREI